MTATNTDIFALDQFIQAPPAKVWCTLTEPDLHARWRVPGGHCRRRRSPLPSADARLGAVPCEVVEVIPERRLVYTFNETWTLTWRLVAEGTGTRLFLEHSGFDFDQKSERDAFTRMGPGWRDQMLPRLAQMAAQLTPDVR